MAEKKAAKKKEPEAQPDQFFNTNDWPLYRKKDLFRVKEQEDGRSVIVSEDGKAKFIDTEELLADYEPVKGLHKRAF